MRIPFIRLWGLVALLLWPLSSQAQTPNWETILNQTREELREAMETRNRELAEAERELVPQAQEIRQLEQEISALRSEVNALSRSREETQRSLRLSQEEQRREAENRQFVSSLGETFLEEQRRGIWSLRNGAEAAANFPLSLRNALNEAARARGGSEWTSEVILPDGRVVPGSIRQWGPVLFHFDPESSTGGLLFRRAGNRDLVLEAYPSRWQSSVEEFAKVGSGPLPLDPTLGDAWRRESELGSFTDQILAGGWIMIPILLLGLAAIIVFVGISLQLLRISRPSLGEVQKLIELYKSGNQETWTSRLNRSSPPAREIFQLTCDRLAWDRESLEELLSERILTWRLRLESYLPLIAVTAAVAPLLGLLGTVTGMIFTFDLIALFGTGDARSLSGGISEALITTQYGLIVAIPALIAHAFLQRKVRGIITGLEQWALATLNELHDRDLSHTGPTRSNPDAG